MEHEDRIAQARHVYEEANKKLRQGQEKEERLMLLEAWKEFEKREGDEATRKVVENLMPRRVKKRRKVTAEDGSDQGWEEYFDYIFPEDEAAKPNLKLLAMASSTASTLVLRITIRQSRPCDSADGRCSRSVRRRGPRAASSRDG